MRQVAPGTYEAEFPSDVPGPYHLDVHEPRG